MRFCNIHMLQLSFL